jgi:hypothetical protein
MIAAIDSRAIAGHSFPAAPDHMIVLTGERGILTVHRGWARCLILSRTRCGGANLEHLLRRIRLKAQQ